MFVKSSPSALVATSMVLEGLAKPEPENVVATKRGAAASSCRSPAAPARQASSAAASSGARIA
jgi:hypothetical protein